MPPALPSLSPVHISDPQTAWLNQLLNHPAFRNKKRASAVAGDLPATGRPLTRSGSARLLSKAAANTRRTSAGFSGRQQEQQAPAAAAGEAQQQQCAGEMEWGDGPSGGIAGGRYRSSAGSRGSFSLASRGTGGSSAGGGDVTGWRTSLEPAGSGALYVRGGRTCAVVDGCLRDDPAECLTLCVSSFTGLQVSGEGWLQLAEGLAGGGMEHGEGEHRSSSSPPPHTPSTSCLSACCPFVALVLRECQLQPGPRV